MLKPLWAFIIDNRMRAWHATTRIAAIALFGTGSVVAHVTMQPTEAQAGASLQAWFTVPHGCDGSSTVAIRVKIPDGVTLVKPQMKAGWKVSIKRRKLSQPYKGEGGHTITETVDEVEWRGGPLPDELYDDFGLKLKVPDVAGQALYFPVVQECEGSVHRWIDIPTVDQHRGDLRSPAPSVNVTAKPK